MNNNRFCPDCNSCDVQEINETTLKLTNENGVNWWVAVILLIVFSPAGLIYLLYKLVKRLLKPKDELQSNIYKVCRSCGCEFN